jgi:hypothetical protein
LPIKQTKEHGGQSASKKKIPLYPKMLISTHNKFISIIYYLCAESTATRPITDTAQCTVQIIIIIIIIIISS